MSGSRESASTYLLILIRSKVIATILLIRHAAHQHLGRVLSGRAGDVPLSQAGLERASVLARGLAGECIDAVHTSPLRRARETAQAFSAEGVAPPEVSEALNEIDFGKWTGKPFAELGNDPHWQEWNTHRSRTAPPGGEPMAAVQARVLAYLRQIARHSSGSVVAMVSHADVIRAAVAGILGLSLDRILSFDIDPASVTRIEAGDWGERVVTVNERGCA